MPDEAGAPAAPLILTLWLDDASFTLFDRLRRTHFPPERNFIPAHLTLFHHLSGDELPAVLATLGEACRVQTPFALAVRQVRSLGRGVAFFLESSELTALRARLVESWRDRLTPQDRQPYRPHITIQNKVDPAEAHRLLADILAGFAPFDVEGRGLLLWRYRGGPWEAVAELPFSPDIPASRRDDRES